MEQELEQLEIEREKFNNSNYNHKKGFLGAVIIKSRKDLASCSYCPTKLCKLCEHFIETKNPLELYQEINSIEMREGKHFIIE